MYFSNLILLVLCATTHISVAKPTGGVSSIQTQAGSTAESSTRSLQSGINGVTSEGFSQAESSSRSIQDGVGGNGFSQAQSSSRSVQDGVTGQSFSETQSFASSDDSSAASSGQGGDRFQQLFRFVHDQEIIGEEEFDRMLQKMDSIIEREYSQAAKELKKWNQIEELAQHEQEAEIGLALAKEQLEEIIMEAGNELRTGLRGCNKGGEGYQQQIWELRQKFESEIRDSLGYFIQALKGINSLDFGSAGKKSSRCIGGKRKKKLAARSIGSGFIEAGKGMVGQAVGAGKSMVNSGFEMEGEIVNSASNLKTGMAKKATDFGGDMINEASSAAGSMAQSGVEMGGQMFNSARGIGEGIAETATGFAGGMGGSSGPKNGGKCKHGAGGKGPHQGGQGHAQGGGYGIESSGQATSAAVAGTTQEFGNNGDDYYSSTSSSARSYANAESGTESKSLSI